MLVRGTGLSLVVVAALTATLQAFSPAMTTTTTTTTRVVSRRIPTTTIVSAGLEVVEEDEDVAKDPFELYEAVPEQTAVCIKDTYVSTTGMAVGTNAQEVLTLQYTANFIAEDAPQFDFADNFVCKTGSSAMLPGFEEGVMVRCVYCCCCCLYIRTARGEPPGRNEKRTGIGLYEKDVYDVLYVLYEPVWVGCEK